MNERLLQQTRREYAPWQRLLLLAMLAPLFIVLIPTALILGARWLDRALHLPRLPGGWPLRALGGVMAVAGWLLALWTISVQFDRGRGTPVPVMATQRLIVEPPYTYTRNPMVLGSFGMYLGLAVMRRSLSGIALVLAVATVLLAYVKRAEESEMLARFGEDYAAYRARTPFLLPRWTRRQSPDGQPGRLEFTTTPVATKTTCLSSESSGDLCACGHRLVACEEAWASKLT